MPDIRTRLKEIGEYTDGWFNGEGHAFNPTDLEIAGAFIRGVCRHFDMAEPYIYALESNGLSCEWTTEENHAEVDAGLIFDFLHSTIQASITQWSVNETDAQEWNLKLDDTTIFEVGHFLSKRRLWFGVEALDGLIRKARELAAIADRLPREVKYERIAEVREAFYDLAPEDQEKILPVLNNIIDPLI